MLRNAAEVDERMLIIKDRIVLKQQGNSVSKYEHVMLYEDSRRRVRNRRGKWRMNRVSGERVMKE